MSIWGFFLLFFLLGVRIFLKRGLPKRELVSLRQLHVSTKNTLRDWHKNFVSTATHTQNFLTGPQFCRELLRSFTQTPTVVVAGRGSSGTVA